MPKIPEAPTHLLGEIGIYTVTGFERRKSHWFAMGIARCCGEPFERRVDRLRVDEKCWRCDRKTTVYRPPAMIAWPTPKVELLRHRAIMSKPFGAI